LVNCNVKIVNALDNNNIYSINYIPFSISTIKLLIQNKESSEIKVRIKPIRSQNDEDYCGGFDDDKNGLKIIWGGGQENGLEVTVDEKKNKYAFLFVFHMGAFNMLPEYKLTLQINKKKAGSHIENTTEEIYIKLLPIQNISLIQNISHQNVTKNSLFTEFTFDGDLVGYYYPRWYPELFNYIGGDTNNYYKSEPLIRNISFKIFVKDKESDRDRIVLNFKDNEIAVIDGDMDGASYQIEAFRFNSTIIIRLWFLWISKNQFRKRINLEPLLQEKDEKGFDFFTNPELPDLERFDIVVSSNGNILAVCTDFHWQEYWYKKRSNDENITGMIAKLVHPFEDSLDRLLQRVLVKNEYKNIITNLEKIISPNKNRGYNSQMICSKGEEIEIAIQERKKEEAVLKGTNFFRSHVPYIRNSDILSNMVSHIVIDHDL
jgi:hypothetical protein